MLSVRKISDVVGDPGLESAFPLTTGNQLLPHRARGRVFGVSRPMLLF